MTEHIPGPTTWNHYRAMSPGDYPSVMQGVRHCTKCDAGQTTHGFACMWKSDDWWLNGKHMIECPGEGKDNGTTEQ